MTAQNTKKNSFITLPSTMIYGTIGNNLDPVIVLGLFFRLGTKAYTLVHNPTETKYLLLK